MSLTEATWWRHWAVACHGVVTRVRSDFLYSSNPESRSRFHASCPPACSHPRPSAVTRYLYVESRTIQAQRTEPVDFWDWRDERRPAVHWSSVPSVSSGAGGCESVSTLGSRLDISRRERALRVLHRPAAWANTIV